jgi:hypothetical protein
MTFNPGANIAVKVPASRHAATVAFYRDTVGLPHLGTEGAAEIFGFGGIRLWLDRVDHATQPEVWLELTTDDVEIGARVLEAAGARITDEIEPLGDLDGHWIMDPAGTVLLLTTSPADRAGQEP